MSYGDAAEDINVTHVMADQDMHWEHGSDEGMTIPKVEPMDEDLRLDEIKEAPLTPVPSNTSPTSAQPKAKRPRGRPRKHPLTPVVTTNKVTKGRSKTGCLTCRKRKKKCDEAKPRCTSNVCPRCPCLYSALHALCVPCLHLLDHFADKSQV